MGFRSILGLAAAPPSGIATEKPKQPVRKFSTPRRFTRLDLQMPKKWSVTTLVRQGDYPLWWGSQAQGT
jgi:hypothetical protein